MTKGKKNEPKLIHRWNPDDLTSLDNRTRHFSLFSPYELELDLERLTEFLKCSQTEPRLTLLESIFREFEDEAKKILEENGLDSEELTELWSTFFDVKKCGPLDPLRRIMDDDYPSLTYPIDLAEQLQNAAHIPFCVDRVRNDISNGDAEQTAIDMLKLCFATVGANLHEIIVRGIRAKAAPLKGGRVPKKLTGVLAVIKKVYPQCERKDAFSLFKYFADNHSGLEKNPLNIPMQKGVCGVGKVFCMEGKNKQGRSRPMIFQIFGKSHEELDDKTLQGIGLPTFRRYVSEIKKELNKKIRSK